MGTHLNPKRTVADDVSEKGKMPGPETPANVRAAIRLCGIIALPMVRWMQGISHVSFLISVLTVFLAVRSEAAASSSSRLEIVGDKLYIAGIGHGFHVLDISKPAKPKWIGAWNNHTCPVGVQVVDGLAYLVNRTSGFEVIDVSDPVSPASIGHLSTGGDLQTVQVTGSHAYVADERRGFDIIDISDPKHPKLAGDFETKGQGWAAVAEGDHVYASYGGGILRVYQLTNGTSPKLTKESPGLGSCSLQLAGGKLLTQHFGVLCLLDLQNPANPTIVADSQLHLSFFSSTCVRDSLAFVTGGSMGLGICELGAGKLRLLGSIQTSYQGWGVRVRGNFAYVVDGGSNLHVFDVSNPAQPVEVNRVGAENFCSQVLSLAENAAKKSSTSTIAGATAITNEPPQLTAGARMVDGNFTFSLGGVPGSTYEIQASTDLVHWQAISARTLPETGVSTITDADARLFDKRFYRSVKKQ